MWWMHCGIRAESSLNTWTLQEPNQTQSHTLTCIVHAKWKIWKRSRLHDSVIMIMLTLQVCFFHMGLSEKYFFKCPKWHQVVRNKTGIKLVPSLGKFSQSVYMLKAKSVTFLDKINRNHVLCRYIKVKSKVNKLKRMIYKSSCHLMPFDVNNYIILHFCP